MSFLLLYGVRYFVLFYYILRSLVKFCFIASCVSLMHVFVLFCAVFCVVLYCAILFAFILYYVILIWVESHYFLLLSIMLCITYTRNNQTSWDFPFYTSYRSFIIFSNTTHHCIITLIMHTTLHNIVIHHTAIHHAQRCVQHYCTL